VRRSLVLTLCLVLVASLVLPAGAQDPDRSHLDPAFLEEIDRALLHGTVTPPGAPITEKEAELVAYDSLVQGYRDLTEDELIGTYFKDGLFGEIDEVDRRYRPRADVEIVRDAQWGVPHIFGDTDEAMAFGAGFASAEDRLPIMELLRALGRAEAFELLETAPAWFADGEILRLYGYTEEEFQAMIDRMPEVYGDIGHEIVAMLDAHAAGINHFITQMQAGFVPAPVGLADLLPPNEVAPWRPTDIVAVVSIVRALFGASGGGELANAVRWLDLVDEYGDEQARAIYEDFRNRHNLDGPLKTLDESFSYMVPAMPMPGTEGNVLGYGPGDSGIQGILEELGGLLLPTSASAWRDDLARLDEASRLDWDALRLETAAGVIDLSRGAQSAMSNWLAVAAEHTTTGHPILLGGPQAGYWDPQILVESELHSPTIHARGAGFPGLSTLVVIGRSHQAAWTATAGGSDMIDTYLVVLCDPDGGTPTEQERHYLFDTNGDGELECVPMDVRLHRESVTLPGGEVLPPVYAERTVHGPVHGRGKVGEVPVAVARKRSTYMKELDPAVSILRMNRGEAVTARNFVEIFGEGHNLSTSWAYVNGSEIAWFHGGLYPFRPDTIHPDLPVWGTGQWEWERDPATGEDRYYPWEMHPHEIEPERGYAVSWNNRTAPGWGNDDSGWNFSSVYRADLLADQLEAEIAADRKIDPVRLTQLMQHAGLSDLRGSHVLPVVLEVLDAAPAPSDRAAVMRDVLAAWTAPQDSYLWGALRRDGDGDGDYDAQAAVAIMDAWWAPLVSTVFDPALGRNVMGVTRSGLDNAPGSAGSAYQGGMYGQVWTDLATALGKQVLSPTSQIFCGSDEVGVDGTLEACAERLWASLDEVGEDLADDQGTDDPTEWTMDASAERIVFLPNAALTMHWVNRPTTQVLAMFGTAEDDVPPVAAPPPPLPATGGGVALVVLALALLGVGVRRQW
jgi:acyl-homoserine lactone acylase PvdQ